MKPFKAYIAFLSLPQIAFSPRNTSEFNAREIYALENDLRRYIKSEDLQKKLDTLETKLNTKIEDRVSKRNFMSEFYEQVDPKKLKDKLPSNCISACNNH